MDNHGYYQHQYKELWIPFFIFFTYILTYFKILDWLNYKVCLNNLSVFTNYFLSGKKGNVYSSLFSKKVALTFKPCFLVLLLLL